MERWRTRAIDAYFRARHIDDLTVREPAGSPDLYRDIDDSSATFYALACSSPDLPSTQAAYMVFRALDDLETALKAGGAPPSPYSPPPASELDELTINQARYRFNHALAVLRALLGDIAPPGRGRVSATPQPPVRQSSPSR
jgi:phosphoglycolate phosphatase-like HAD superfamily hydrolase